VSSPAIEIRGLRKVYGDTVALDGLDLVVPRGATYALLGPNGSGKTTTIRTLLRIQEPDAGQVRVLGEEPGPEVRDRVGYLPEERGLYPRMKVRDVLTFLAELKGIPPNASRPRIEGWLERVGLAARAEDQVQGLSKGMQQKLQFIAAVVHEPEVVILDEPFGGLDPINQQALREIIGEIRRSERTILFSTHIIEHAERLCDHVCILSRGRAVVEGEVGRVKREHGGRHVGLTLDPWTPAAVAAVRAAPEAARVHEDGHAIELTLADGADPRALLSRLVQGGVGLTRFEVVEPSLHQVFIERVGTKPIEEGALV
jgi:ABC-2 type transport system ATP-binding protein